MVHSVVGVWRIVGAGDQRLQRLECSDRQGTSVTFGAQNVGVQNAVFSLEKRPAVVSFTGLGLVNHGLFDASPDLHRTAVVDALGQVTHGVWHALLHTAPIKSGTFMDRDRVWTVRRPQFS